jgi:hypothetical protein
MKNNSRLAIIFLTVIGLLQFFAVSFQLPELRRFAFATTASPLPEVFGASEDGHEPMRTTNQLHLIYKNGITVDAALGEKNRRQLITSQAGHLTRFAPYFYALNWAPNFNPATRDQLLRHAFCGHGRLTTLLKLPSHPNKIEITIRERVSDKVKFQYEISCEIAYVNSLP